MTKLNVNDLPPKMRAKVLADHGAEINRNDGKHRAGHTAGADGWCHTCKERITTWPMWQRHQTATGHGRLQIFPYHD